MLATMRLTLAASLVSVKRGPLLVGQRFTCARMSVQANNPNNEAFWRQRGYSSRPRDWEKEAQRLKAQGQFTAAANAAGAQTKEQSEYIGKVMRVVGLAAKKVLGADTQIRKGGSQAKKTNIAGSDLDVLLQPKAPMTARQKRELVAELRDTCWSVSGQPFGGFKKVKETNFHIVLVCKRHGLQVDIVPEKATFRAKPASPPKDRFKNNPVGREVVRMIKEKYPVKKYPSWKGERIELAVIQTQQQQKGLKNLDLFDRTVKHLQS